MRRNCLTENAVPVLPSGVVGRRPPLVVVLSAVVVEHRRKIDLYYDPVDPDA